MVNFVEQALLMYYCQIKSFVGGVTCGLYQDINSESCLYILPLAPKKLTLFKTAQLYNSIFTQEFSTFAL